MKWRTIFFWMRLHNYAMKKAEELLTGTLITIVDNELYVGTELMKYAKMWGVEVQYEQGDDKNHFTAFIERKGVRLVDYYVSIQQRSAYEIHNREVRHGRS